MKFNNLNKKGTVDDWLPLLTFIIVAVFLITFFGLFFIKGGPEAKQVEDSSLDTTYAEAQREGILYLNSKVSKCWPNYKTDFYADESTTFADIIPKICNKLNGDSRSFLNNEDEKVGYYYVTKQGNKCINGLLFVQASQKYFEGYGENVGFLIEDLLNNKPSTPILHGPDVDKNYDKFLNILLPSYTPFKTISFIMDFGK